ncbi:hypothetical protein PFLUV_G00138250 [Perca fluviatilis]|uniref:Uncharacterized protein n=1 Tax=Perca fluviatilis TaxID=8168 RepID=A0A6A5E5N1_PERFL|nr:hypothetical protein PFLUV_G00138250 [Perca fluviatilis]
MRRMLRRVATNDVLKLYILRGRKGKKAFQDLTICRVITVVSQKNFPVLTAADAEDLIGSLPHTDGQLRRTEPSKPWSSIYFLFLRKQELLAIFYTAAILLPPPLWHAI